MDESFATTNHNRPIVTTIETSRKSNRIEDSSGGERIQPPPLDSPNPQDGGNELPNIISNFM